jgi:hypothetical protein
VEQEVALATLCNLRAADPPREIDAQAAVNLISAVAGLPETTWDLEPAGVVPVSFRSWATLRCCRWGACRPQFLHAATLPVVPGDG